MSHSAVHASVLRNEYRDSMILMLLSTRLEKQPGVERALAIMGGETGRSLLEGMGLLTPEAAAAGPTDLVISLRAADDLSAERAIAGLDALLQEQAAAQTSLDRRYRSLDGALRDLPAANLAAVSVPGRHAAREARLALRSGLNVLLFSDNVPLDEEIALKRLASERGLLLMGPDCGTAIVGGIGLGFANVVRAGSIGIVGASGTGIQEVSCLLDATGSGVSHALGAGGRDLSREVGAATTLRALDMLASDPATETIILISKPPAPEIASRVLDRAAQCGKPVVACLLGVERDDYQGVQVVSSLAGAADAALALRGQSPASSSTKPSGPEIATALSERSRLAPGQRYLRGLYSGGTLCEEALLAWRDAVGAVWSNAPLSPERRLSDPNRSREHTAVDLGDDFFTTGRPHPMIDLSSRIERLGREAIDPETAVVVLDLVLGYGAHPDPAGELAPAIRAAKETASQAGRYLPVIVRVVGTNGDPQGLKAQAGALQEAGVIIARSNQAAAALAALVVGGQTDGCE